MSILLPVNPPYAGMLVDGVKTIEWRKKPLPEGIAYIYETKKNGGCGMVIGEVYFGATNGVPKELLGSEKEGLDYLREKRYSDSVIDRTMEMTAEFVRDGKVSKKYLAKYAKGHKAIYANDCWDYRRYGKPIPLSEFFRPCNWKYDCGTCKRWLRGSLDCNDQITRPPQSWCYAMLRLKGETE